MTGTANFLRAVRYGLNKDISARYEFSTCFSELRGMQSIIPDLYPGELGENMGDVYRTALERNETAIAEAKYCRANPELFDDASVDEEDTYDSSFWDGVAEAWSIVMDLAK